MQAEINKRPNILVIILIILFVASFMTLFIWMAIDATITNNRNDKLCAQEYPQYQYALNQNPAEVYSEEITEEYINCCWTEPHLNTEEAYTKNKCKGLKT